MMKRRIGVMTKSRTLKEILRREAYSLLLCQEGRRSIIRRNMPISLMIQGFKAQLVSTYKLVLKRVSSKAISNICKCLDG